MANLIAALWRALRGPTAAGPHARGAAVRHHGRGHSGAARLRRRRQRPDRRRPHTCPSGRHHRRGLCAAGGGH
ncbi:MAG: hypothetical protein MZW92_52985 [Comamonadaceae bacterium]|nr:hypothetical protein [Comamonadaceae bacterium]